MISIRRMTAVDVPVSQVLLSQLGYQMDVQEGTPELSLGACRILEPVSLWSNEEAQSADKIIAWAVRPRECEIKASSAEGAAEIVALLSRAIPAN